MALDRHVAQEVHMGGGVAILREERERVTAECAPASVLGEELPTEVVEVSGVQDVTRDAVQILDLPYTSNTNKENNTSFQVPRWEQ